MCPGLVSVSFCRESTLKGIGGSGCRGCDRVIPGGKGYKTLQKVEMGDARFLGSLGLA